MHLSISKDKILKFLLISLLFFLAGHAFCYCNPTFSGESFTINAQKASNTQISSGAFLLPIYWKLRAPVASPLFIGMLSFLSLFASSILLCDLFGIARISQYAVLSGVLTLNSFLLSFNSSNLHTAEVPWISFLLSVLAIWLLLKESLLFLARPFSLVCAVLSIGLFPPNVQLLPGLILLVLLYHKRASLPLPSGFLLHSMLLFVFSVAFSLSGFYLMSRIKHLDFECSFHFIFNGRSGSFLYPLFSLFTPVNAYPIFYRIFRIVLLSLALILLRRDPLSLSVLAMLLFCPSLPVFTNQDLGQFLPSFLLIDVGFLLIIFPLFDQIPTKICLLLCYSICFLGAIVFSNQVYLKLALNFDSALSVMTRVIARIESIPEFHPGETPTAFLGTLEESVYSVERPGFSHLSSLEAASYNTALMDNSQITWYLWETLGYPFELVSDYDKSILEKNETVQAMTAFPSLDSCKMIDGVLVVRLSR